MIKHTSKHKKHNLQFERAQRHYVIHRSTRNICTCLTLAFGNMHLFLEDSLIHEDAASSSFQDIIYQFIVFPKRFAQKLAHSYLLSHCSCIFMNSIYIQFIYYIDGVILGCLHKNALYVTCMFIQQKDCILVR